MEPQTEMPKPCCHGMTFLRSWGWLLLGMLAAFPFLAAWKYHTGGADGVIATLIAFAICFTSATAALWVTHRWAGDPQAGPALLFSMLIRTGVPLGAGMLLAQSSWLAAVGILGLVMLYYLISLVLETTLAARILKSRTGTQPIPEA